MKTYELNGETIVLQHIVNVSKVFEQETKRKDAPSIIKYCIGVKTVGRESGFIYSFEDESVAESTRQDLLTKLEKA